MVDKVFGRVLVKRIRDGTVGAMARNNIFFVVIEVVSIKYLQWSGVRENKKIVG